MYFVVCLILTSSRRLDLTVCSCSTNPEHIYLLFLAWRLLYPPHCSSKCLLSKKKMSVSLQTPNKITTRHCGLRSCKTPCLERPYMCTRAATGRRRRKGTGTCARKSSDGRKKELLSISKEESCLRLVLHVPAVACSLRCLVPDNRFSVAL